MHRRLTTFASLEDLLLAQSAITGIVLLVFSILLARRGLFRWTAAGFWAWIAFALYFCLNPLASMRWNSEQYHIDLALSGGLARGEWIGFVAIMGIIVFFVSYLRASTRPVTWGLRYNAGAGPLGIVLMVCLLAAAAYCLLAYRVGAISGAYVEMEGGRYVGQVTGYENSAHLFFFIPVAALLLSSSRLRQLLGLLMGCGYVVLSMPAPWSRFAAVSMLLAMLIIAATRRPRGWPRLPYLIVVLLIAGVLQLRGHMSMESASDFVGFVTRIPDEAGSILAGGDSAMLASWYLESFVKDRITGYDYGLPFINYVLFGWIPNRLFPQKYFLVDWLRAAQPPLQVQAIVTWLTGAKSTLLGSFYANGGIVAVVLLMWVMGALSRRMDGMLSEKSPLLVRATGVSWMGCLWMVWGSQDYWGLTLIGTLAIPALLLWLLTPKMSQSTAPATPSALETDSSFNTPMRP